MFQRYAMKNVQWEKFVVCFWAGQRTSGIGPHASQKQILLDSLQGQRLASDDEARGTCDFFVY